MYSNDEKIEITNWYQAGNIIINIRDQFAAKYTNRPIPALSTIHTIIKTFNMDGCIISTHKRRNKPSHILTEELKLNVLCFIEENPITPTNKRLHNGLTFQERLYKAYKCARRRFRRPSTSVRKPVSQSKDQVVSASVSRRRLLKRPKDASDNAIASTKITKKDKDGYKVVCYYTNWSQYRPKTAKFTPEDIIPDLCTHVIFAFGWLKKGKLSAYESNDETKDGKIGLYDRIANLKKANPKLKTLLAVELREAFEAEAQELKKPRLLLTAAVPVGPDNIKGGYDVPAVASYLDFINLMAYDFHGKWERETGHNAPLYAPSSDSEWRKQLSVDHAANLWVRLGAPKEKLIIGMPTYGRTFTLSNSKKYGVNSPASGGGKEGTYTKESGFLAYYEVCEMLLNGATYIWHDEMKTPYCVQGDQWVGFDDEKSIRMKMKWIKDSGFGGAMVWSLDQDDFTGTMCGGNVKYPLIGAIREELRGISRGKDAKDMDWEKVAGAEPEEEEEEPEEKPPAKRISVEQLLARVKPKKKIGGKSSLRIQKNAILNDSWISVRKPQVLCYMTKWSQKRPGAGRFSPEDIDAKLCTHVVYAFATLKEHKLAEADDKDEELYERVIALRDKNPDLKILLAIGGWAFGSTPFKELTSNVFRMNQFVYDAIDFLRDYKFNGLDVDWEYPRGADDREAYVNLLKELRTAFEGEAKSSGEPRLLLTAAVPASFEAIAAGYDVPEISKYLDLINVMTYDFHGQWERTVGHNSPLFPLESATSYQKKLTVDYSAREWVKQGAPKEKLMIGMPTYGRSFELVNTTQFDIGAPASGGGTPGQFTNEAGFMSYYEICDFLQEENTTLVWDNEQQVPFAYRDNQWIAWLKEEGFGGIMIWSVDMDDFRGRCGGGKYPLINAMRQELEGYKVKLEYSGPYESSAPIGQYTTKDPNEIKCEEEEGHISYHPDKSDCTRYWMCEGDRKHHMPCPLKLVFNPDQNVCDWPENVESCLQHTEAPPASRR
ncbi:chitinase [Holotrichia oblita]|uniref:Chitinase n=1 Tax=Holotrichia oblita TaxID=644536 RepID=A0ACB9SPY4_HOLOL|nr:chitinase [Holotrichia oblita]